MSARCSCVASGLTAGDSAASFRELLAIDKDTAFSLASCSHDAEAGAARFSGGCDALTDGARLGEAAVLIPARGTDSGSAFLHLYPSIKKMDDDVGCRNQLWASSACTGPSTSCQYLFIVKLK